MATVFYHQTTLFYNQTNIFSFAAIPRKRSEWAQCYSRDEKGRETTRNRAIETRWSTI